MLPSAQVHTPYYTPHPFLNLTHNLAKTFPHIFRFSSQIDHIGNFLGRGLPIKGPPGAPQQFRVCWFFGGVRMVFLII